jgi:hypothetical protein
MGGNLSYDNSYFQLARIHCKDGFNVSIQINNGNYCETEMGYRKFGLDWQDVEFGLTSVHEEKLVRYSNNPDTRGGVGKIDTDTLQEILDDHGGIDWEATLSHSACMHLLVMDVAKEFTPSS